MQLLRSVAAATALLSPILASAQNSSSSLPVVDLGYQLHRAISFNETRGYYNFSNIRYAAPPVGDLRFKAPQAPETDRSVVDDGSIDRICPQASTSNANVSDPRETEDCLFLDVMVPQKIFENAGNDTAGAPVIVWIHGGGYIGGSKAGERTPAGLMLRSATDNSTDANVIFVGLNYRLGAFGWLAGPTLQENGTANAGLHDQRLALQWVQDNIHLFGGDKSRVTVVGESAGGGSIMHQLTAYGGRAKAPFAQAVPQSPAWLPFPSLYGQDQIFTAFASAATAGSLAALRQLPSAALVAVNKAFVYAAGSTSGTSPFGPAIDGDFVTQDPKALLNHGQYDSSVKIMVGHNANETLAMVPAAVASDAIVDAFVAAALPYAPAAVQSYITTTLYPASNASDLYSTPFERLALILAEASIVCNAFALNTARGSDNASYAYLFAVSPAYHGQDVPHTFYDPGSAPSSGDGGVAASYPFNTTVATVLQDYITGFAMNGVPASALDGLAEGVPEYGADASLVRLGSGTGIGVQRDETANERCKWWSLNYLS
ncbi:Acetylcholinesterase precursor [Lasiodiplodia theobromae]|uniref:Acetylcholinesterase precursor n=1 Tax=Lasiodiplodia theobromae TaxID=45133 RepID=UPI0015C3ECE7|nr:Acetylcholinesterase precursor [Lasiodiplodia theobromae]KAF4537623.1 Acetylcholinesterase precursor [Lasiodiplodia theobromae]